MTLLGTLALRYTLRAKVGSVAFTRSPSSSEHSNYNTNKYRSYSGPLMVEPVVKFSVLMSSILLIITTAAVSWSSRPTLSSFSHFSSSCLRPCCRTGRHSSKDSNLLSWPWSSRIPKYCNNGEAWPGWAGTLWNLRMVSAVRRIPWEGEKMARRIAVLQISSDYRTVMVTCG